MSGVLLPTGCAPLVALFVALMAALLHLLSLVAAFERLGLLCPLQRLVLATRFR